ncbi:ACT domain-containing protein [Deferrisoma sp.]
MSGEKDLGKLLGSLAPVLRDGEYVFCTFPGARYGDYADLEPVASVLEAEGLTLVVPKPRADERGLGYEGVFRWIALRVHSSLEAVGLTAAFSGRLAERGISANVVAGYHHDHIFVPKAQAEEALEALEELARSADERG